MTSPGIMTSLPPLLLATDLDGTFASGTDEDRFRLYERLARRPQCSLCYATGRHLESARALQDVFHLPVPDVFIADVGATVAAGERGRTLDFPDHDLRARWPGGDIIERRLALLAGMLEPQALPTDSRLSYLVRDGYAVADALAKVREALAGVDVEVVGSAGVYIDVLPGGVNKGTTLRRVVDWIGIDRDAVVVAGDSLNDLAMFETGFKGVVVGNAEPQLRELVGGADHVYCAHGEGAGGVHEGLRHFGFLEPQS